ncbi:MAG: hypothetical protein ACRD0C_04110 [Acidimicrobiia bacterium]
MVRSFSRRARIRFRVLGAAVMVAGPCFVLAPAPGRALAAPDNSPATACGDGWSSAEQLGSLPGGLLEVSGFVSSARYPGVAWMVRDSDNPRSIYSFTLDGDRPRWKEFPVPGTDNHDWEDVTYTVGADGVGRLWILENGEETGPKTIYEVLEPDPDQDRSARLAASYRVVYPGSNINTESIFVLGGRLAVVTKTSPNRVFQLPATLSRSGTNRLSEAGRLRADSWLTAVGVSADERLLATVSTEDVVSVFESPAGSGEFRAFADESPVFHDSMVKTQRESLDFYPYDSCNLVSVSEDGTVWRLANAHSIYPTADPGPAPGDGSGPGTGTAPPPAPPPVPPGSDFHATPPAVRGPADAGRVASGYWTLGTDGTVTAFGDAIHRGEPGPAPDQAPAVDLEPTPSGAGYRVVDSRGRVSAHGDAVHLGDVPAGSLAPGGTVTSLSGLPGGDGYRIFTSRGRVLAFGAAGHLGDLAGVRLNGPVLDSVTTPSGAGYYMVAADGGIFTFGDAVFSGSMGGTRLNAPVRSAVPDPDGAGYWLVAADGGVFAFDAPFRGSLGSVRLNRPVAGMVSFGDGYLMVGEDGGVFNFSGRPFSGSLGAHPPAHPVVSIAALE